MAKAVQSASTLEPVVSTENILDYALSDSSSVDVLSSHTATTIATDANGVPVTTEALIRTKSKVLFVTTNTEYADHNSTKYQEVSELKDVFEEIHILLVVKGSKERPVQEVESGKVFLYPVGYTTWWGVMTAVEKTINQQLIFQEVFRPDLIVALDPFESGHIAMNLAEAYDRPFQVHVLQDFYSSYFLANESNAKKKIRLAKTVLKNTTSVCVDSQIIRDKVKANFTHLDPIILPKFYNTPKIGGANNKKTGVKPSHLSSYKFIILYVGKLDHDSAFYRAIDACRSSLRSPAIALVAIGDGPMKKNFQERAKIFNIDHQVVFEKPTVDINNYMHFSDLLLCPDTTLDSEEVVMNASANGLPILAAETTLRNETFTDGEDAFLCPADDTIGFSQKLSKFLNDTGIRIQFARNSISIIKDKMHQDPQVYRNAYRDAIQSVLESAPK